MFYSHLISFHWDKHIQVIEKERKPLSAKSSAKQEQEQNTVTCRQQYQCDANQTGIPSWTNVKLNLEVFCD